MDSSPGGSKLPSSQPAPAAPPSSWDRDADQDAKRPSSQSALLPPLELLSSPGLPNTTSRRLSRPGSSSKHPSAVNNTARNNSISHAYLKYPTPVPTSSTGILSSSPPRVNHHDAANAPRPPTQRAPSIVSERAPLSAVPSVELNENGDTLLMGRSSNSSHYQLSANRLISRVHVKARYVPASVPLQPNKIEVECDGWNGLKLSCQGRTYDMHRGDVLSFEAEGAEIMLDVQDARVLIHWPKRDLRDDLGWEDSPRSVRSGEVSPVHGAGSPRAGADGSDVGIGMGLLQSSPLRKAARIGSPESPTPAHASLRQALLGGDPPSNSQVSSVLSDLPSASEREQSVEIYEDGDADQSFITDVSKSFSSDLGERPSDDEDAENDPDEENDPVVHSFGPYGHDLNNRLASFKPSSPKRRRLDSGAFVSSSPRLNSNSHRSSKSASTPHQASPTPTPDDRQEPAAADRGKEPASVPNLTHVDVATVTNHVVNQLAFSRLSSTPLTTLLSNLPTDDRAGLSRDELRYIVEDTTCIGTIPRQGKDADGKPLESQYYYVPEKDDDGNRRAAVVDGLRKPTLRNCRKHHVVRGFVSAPSLAVCWSYVFVEQPQA